MKIIFNFFAYNNSMKIVLTGGGTGGHVIPNISLLPELKKHFDEIYYLGGSGIEKELISKIKNIKFVEVPVCKRNKSCKICNLILPFKLLNCTYKIKKILKKIKPDVVFSKGGYVSLPVCLASFLLKIPIVSHESDMTMGKANKIIYKISSKMCTTFEKTSENLKKAIFTGSPIRSELTQGQKSKGLEITKLKDDKPFILITGGSTGAESLNEVVYKALPQLTKKYNVIHLVGKNKGKKISSTNYCQMEFCTNIEHLFALASVVVSRAGSNAICELLYLKKPMLLIPLPKSSTSRGDQIDNAKYFEKKNLAKVLLQENLTPKTLCSNIDFVFFNKKNLSNISSFSNGNKNIVNIILNVIKNNQI